uniref:Uncharacterized protein n=1 Tax=Romanomermis culicivorax TaxID=13658 RepID=A0A915IRJ2_ROMCU
MSSLSTADDAVGYYKHLEMMKIILDMNTEAGLASTLSRTTHRTSKRDKIGSERSTFSAKVREAS